MGMHLIVVSGMLGVGKTSVMIHLIDDLMAKGHKVSVIENDFGSKGIDGDIIRKNGMEVRELQGGCVCCTMKSGMIDALRFLQSNYNPDIVLMEPTGIADPSYILGSVDGITGLEVTRKSAIIVVDAERFMKMRKMFERPLKNQMNVADLVLINKIDTVTEEEAAEIERSIRELSYEGPIMRVQAEDRVNMDGITDVIM